MKPEDFPTLRSACRYQERFDFSVAAVAAGLAAGSIRNAVFKDAKSYFSNAAESAWKETVLEPHVRNGKYQKLNDDQKELERSILFMGIYDVRATAKKLEKTKATGPMVDAMRKFVVEAMPLFNAIETLKSKVVMGRAPSIGPAKPVNPNQIVQTCPCCFRAIAVVRGKMAHHGYERPGDGYQTSSCMGIGFPPLEVSDAGLRFLIKWTEEYLAMRKSAWAEKGKKTELTTGFIGKLRTVKKGEPAWDSAFKSYVYEMESDIRRTKRDLASFEKRLAIWKPEPTKRLKR